MGSELTDGQVAGINSRSLTKAGCQTDCLLTSGPGEGRVCGFAVTRVTDNKEKELLVPFRS